MENKIDFESIIRTSFACPSQWEGKLVDNRMFYARYRWGKLTIESSNKPVDCVDELFKDCSLIFSDSNSDQSLNGYMTNWQFYSLLESKNLLECNSITRFFIKYFSKLFSFLEKKNFARISIKRIKKIIKSNS